MWFFLVLPITFPVFEMITTKNEQKINRLSKIRIAQTKTVTQKKCAGVHSYSILGEWIFLFLPGYFQAFSYYRYTANVHNFQLSFETQPSPVITIFTIDPDETMTMKM